MAALLAVSIGIGAEKLGRKISEKRLEHKDRKAAKVCLHGWLALDVRLLIADAGARSDVQSC
jgi:hypothetical protein